MDANRAARPLIGPEVCDLARWAISYFAPRSLMPDLGFRRRARFGEAFLWVTVGAAAGALAMYFAGPSGVEHRRELAEWLRKTFASELREPSSRSSDAAASRRTEPNNGGTCTAGR